MGEQVYRGRAASAWLDAQRSLSEVRLEQGLAPFEPIATARAWHRLLLGLIELFNFATEPLDDETIHYRFISMTLGEALTSQRGWIETSLRGLYDGGVETRVLAALEALGGFAPHTISIAELAGYFHTRRRGMVALFYLIPHLCQGAQRPRRPADLTPILRLLERDVGPITQLSQMLMLSTLFDDYVLRIDGQTLIVNRQADLLDEGAMDPERLSVIDMAEFGASSVPALAEPPDPRRLLSKAEVRRQIAHLNAAFAEFDLAETSFGEIAGFLLPLLTGPEDVEVRVPAEPFLSALNGPGVISPERRRALLVAKPTTLGAAVNGFQPFVRIDDELVSDVTLIIRFLNNYKSTVLGHQKRYQIRSGFLFEAKVEAVLRQAGFTLTGITRINRREFDVVTIKGGIIHNFQCKNSFLDSCLLEGRPDRYVRANRRLARSFTRAINKEIAREDLLKTTLGLSQIRHYVVSRFPIVTDNPDIVAFSRLAAVAATI